MDWSALLSTFGLVFVAELGDKTQLAVVTQTCKYRRPWEVFAGASLALVAVTLIGALGGKILGQIIPQSTLRMIAALAFVVMGILIGREAAQKKDRDKEEDCPVPLDAEGNCPAPARWDWKAFGSTFGLLFTAELGDKTQLTVLSLAGKQDTPWLVFIGGSLALTAVTALAAVGGQGLCKLIPERLILWISATAFVGMGVLMGLGIL